MTLRGRLALPFLALSVVVFAILAVVMGEAVEQVYVDRLSDELASQARIAAYSVGEARDSGRTSAEIVDLIDRFGELNDSRITLVDADGQVLADTEGNVAAMENHGDRPELIEARENGYGQDRRTSDTVGESYLYVAVPVAGPGGGFLRVAVPTNEVDAAVATSRRIVLTAVPVLFLATLIGAWWIAGKVARPLIDLRDQAEAVAREDFTVRVEPAAIGEVAAVGHAFNRMAARLEELVEEQARTSMRLEAVMTHLVDGVVLTDGEGTILRINEAARNMLGTEDQDPVGRPFVQVARDHELSSVLYSAFAGKKKPSATVEHGLDRTSILVTARLIEDDGERLGLVVLRDVTDLRRLELIRREFVANVSHELRTPLTSIRALVETLEAGAVDEPEMAQDFLGRIIGEVDRLNALVEDLLDFARLEAGRAPLRLQRVDIGEAVRIGAERLRPQIERAGLHMTIDVAEDLPEIEIDVPRIEQVIVNLIHNAIKFTPSGGSITVRVRQRKNSIVVDVEDTGIGVSVEEQSRLFERFYKSDKARRSEGTGLGLAIVKNIVQLHGGRISVESTPGEGATFSFTLPLGRKKARKRARKHALGLL